MIPSRQAGDLLAGMWQLIVRGWARCPQTLVWDKESAIGGTGRPTVAGGGVRRDAGDPDQLRRRGTRSPRGWSSGATGSWRPRSCPAGRSPRRRTSTPRSPTGCRRANTRRVRSIGDRPVDRGRPTGPAMVALPPLAPAVGLTHRVRLAPRLLRADRRQRLLRRPARDRPVRRRARRPRRVSRSPAPGSSWPTTTGAGPPAPLTDPAHEATAKQLRADWPSAPRARAPVSGTRRHADGTSVAIRALPDYDALFGVDFDPRPTRRPTADGSRRPRDATP